MYPIDNYRGVKRGYVFGQKTSYSAHHLGTDLIVPVGTRIVAPFDGISAYAPFETGGNVINFTTSPYGQKIVMRFMHLVKIVKTGPVKAGELIALSGNTGTQTTGPHIHLDISKDTVNPNNFNNFINPDAFDWGNNIEVHKYMYDRGVTVEAIEDNNIYEKPSTASNVVGHVSKGDLGEVDIAGPDWQVVSFGQGAKYGQVQTAKYKAVPRGGFGGYDKLLQENAKLKEQIALNTAQKKIDQIKEIVK